MSTTPYVQWTERAACVGADPELFFIDEADVKKHVRDTYCKKCPVREACRNFAIDNQYGGFWGYSQSDRNREARFFGKPRAI